MDKTIKSTPQDVFLHLLGFASLYVSVITFIALFFAYVDYLFPDQLNFYLTGTLSQIRWSSSILIIIFPVFIFMASLLGKDFQKNPEKRGLRFRKWLIYFTLFVAAVTIIVDLIVLVFNFYSGELTVKFFWKILVVLLAAAGVFGYYRWELNRTEKKTSWPKTFAGTVSILVAAAMAGGFFIVGSPATQRARRLDEQRVNHLQSIQSQITNYWQQKNALPGELGDLYDSISGFRPPQDPETDLPYEYMITNESSLTFQLCAVFKTSSSFYNRTLKPLVPERNFIDPYQQNWDHGLGRVCFERTIDPDLYGIPERKAVPLLK